MRVRVESANEFHNKRMHVKTEERSNQHPRRVRVTLVHENQTESTRLLRFSGLPCIQVFLKSSKRASVSEDSNVGRRK